jgi:prophage antirepressor-like protein
MREQFNMKNQASFPVITEFTFEGTFNCRTAFNEKTGEISICLSDLLKAQGSKTEPNDVLPQIKAIFGDGSEIVLPIPDSLGRIQDTIFVIEPAAIYVTARGRTEVGKRLNKWIFVDVIPAIRKTGTYSSLGAKKGKKEVSDFDLCVKSTRMLNSLLKTYGTVGLDKLTSMERAVHDICSSGGHDFTHALDACREAAANKSSSSSHEASNKSSTSNSVTNSSVHQFWAMILDRGYQIEGTNPAWEERVNKADFYNEYVKFMNAQGVRYPLSLVALMMKFKQVCPAIQLRQAMAGDTKGVRFRAIVFPFTVKWAREAFKQIS